MEKLESGFEGIEPEVQLLHPQGDFHMQQERLYSSDIRETETDLTLR